MCIDFGEGDVYDKNNSRRKSSVCDFPLSFLMNSSDGAGGRYAARFVCFGALFPVKTKMAKDLAFPLNVQ